MKAIKKLGNSTVKQRNMDGGLSTEQWNKYNAASEEERLLMDIDLATSRCDAKVH